MRAILLLSMLVLVCLPFSTAYPVPTVAIKIDQSTLRTNASNANQPVIFTGSVTVTKSAYLSATVTLTGSVDKGWNASIEPASMTFTTTAPQAFTCTVTVPAGTPGATDAQLSVNGTVVSGIFQGLGTATAMITIVGTLPPPANQTGNGTGGTKPGNGTNQTTIPDGLESHLVAEVVLGFTYVQWEMIGSVAVVVLISAGAVVKVRSRRKAALMVECVETAEEA